MNFQSRDGSSEDDDSGPRGDLRARASFPETRNVDPQLRRLRVGDIGMRGREVEDIVWMHAGPHLDAGSSTATAAPRTCPETEPHEGYGLTSAPDESRYRCKPAGLSAGAAIAREAAQIGEVGHPAMTMAPTGRPFRRAEDT
jgi:hypothetical protein